MTTDKKLFTSDQIRAWDTYTIAHEPISSKDLMYRAASSAIPAILKEWELGFYSQVCVVCGNGNNGGDGFVIASLLRAKGIPVRVFKPEGELSKDALFYAEALRAENCEIESFDKFSVQNQHVLLIDALFGTGLNRPIQPDSEAWKWIQVMNACQARLVSLDLPSGLPAEPTLFLPTPDAVVQADITLTFQVPKLSFLFEEWGRFVGNFQLLNIGLSKDFEQIESSPFSYQSYSTGIGLRQIKSVFSHKRSFGHTGVFAGTKGMQGAAMLAASAALHSGSGLVTMHTAPENFNLFHAWQPELLLNGSKFEHEEDIQSLLSCYSALVVGCGLGTDKQTMNQIQVLLGSLNIPAVFDADAITLLARLIQINPEIRLPSHLVLTPHPGEMQRLLGNVKMNSYKQLDEARRFAEKHQVYVILKGAFTRIIMPDGQVCFQLSSNPMLSSAGTGDVLAGIVGGLLAQGIEIETACKWAVAIHAEAANRIFESGKRSLVASDLLKEIPYLV